MSRTSATDPPASARDKRGRFTRWSRQKTQEHRDLRVYRAHRADIDSIDEHAVTGDELVARAAAGTAYPSPAVLSRSRELRALCPTGGELTDGEIVVLAWMHAAESLGADAVIVRHADVATLAKCSPRTAGDRVRRLVALGFVAKIPRYAPIPGAHRRHARCTSAFVLTEAAREVLGASRAELAKAAAAAVTAAELAKAAAGASEVARMQAAFRRLSAGKSCQASRDYPSLWSGDKGRGAATRALGGAAAPEAPEQGRAHGGPRHTPPQVFARLAKDGELARLVDASVADIRAELEREKRSWMMGVAAAQRDKAGAAELDARTDDRAAAAVVAELVRQRVADHDRQGWALWRDAQTHAPSCGCAVCAVRRHHARGWS